MMLTQAQWQDAVKLWHSGYDTLEIANALGVKEPVIYNKLWLWRAVARKAA